MAERRMFSKRVINSARFLRMPISTQALYFHLGLNADDDGVVEAYPVIRTVGCTEDDLKVLVAKGFVQVLNEDLVSYITDWQENNKIRADRKIDSIYKDLLISFNPSITLIEKRNRADAKKANGQPMDGIGKDRLGKDRIGKDRLEDKQKAKRFSPPTLKEVQEYCNERKNNIDAQRFIDYYTSNGWKVGKNAMKDWKAAVRSWEKNGFDKKQDEPKKETSYDLDEWEKVAMNFGEGE